MGLNEVTATATVVGHRRLLWQLERLVLHAAQPHLAESHS